MSWKKIGMKLGFDFSTSKKKEKAEWHPEKVNIVSTFTSRINEKIIRKAVQ